LRLQVRRFQSMGKKVPAPINAHAA
jgi:hypothetical protein